MKKIKLLELTSEESSKVYGGDIGGGGAQCTCPGCDCGSGDTTHNQVVANIQSHSLALKAADPD